MSLKKKYVLMFIIALAYASPVNDEFESQLKNALLALQSETYGSILINELIESKNGVSIQKSKDGNHTIGTKVEWNPENRKAAQDIEGNTDREPFVGLGHELAHVYDMSFSAKQEVWVNIDGKNIYESEKYATYWENLIRLEHDIPLRKYYVLNKDDMSNPTLLLDSKNSNRYYYHILVMVGKNKYVNIIKK